MTTWPAHVMTSVIGQSDPVSCHQSERPPVHPRMAVWFGWVVAFFACIVLYSMTASRYVQWGDGGEFVLRVARGEATDPLGLALSHPLHFWLCRVAVMVLPVGAPFAVALVSVLAGSIAVANLFGIVSRLTDNLRAAALAALGLAMAHTFWHMSCTVEVYSVTAAALTGELWALVNWDRTRRPRWLVVMMFANGLGLSNHNLALLTAPVVVIVLLVALLRRQARVGTFFIAAGAWVVGASPYLVLIAHEWVVSGELVKTLQSALVGKFSAQVAGHTTLAVYTTASIAFALLNFPNLMIPAALAGATWARKFIPRLSHRVLLADLALHLAFVLRYGVIDQYTFLIPSYVIVSVLAGAGFCWLMSVGKPVARWVLIVGGVVLPLSSPAMYVMTATTVRHFHLLGRWERNKPYRDDYRYLFIPWSRGDDSAHRLSAEAVDLAGTAGVILVEDNMAEPAIRYELFQRGVGDVKVLSEGEFQPGTAEQFESVGGSVVYVPAHRDFEPSDPPGRHWRRVGAMFVLEPFAASRPSR